MSNPEVVLHDVTQANSEYTIPQVLELVIQLAIYEKEPITTVEATVELLRKNLLRDEPYARCVLAYIGGPPGEGKAVGMALYFFSFSTWTGKGGLYLEDLFVSDAYRGKGIAKKLFARLGQIARDRDLARMEWVVLDWNVNAKAVYEKMGAVQGVGWDRMRLSGEALARLADSA